METQANLIDWDFILDTIQEEKCILFLGPELYTNAQNQQLDDALNTYLNIEHNKDIQTYYQEDNLFLFSSRAKKTKTFYKIKNFYNQSFPEAEMLFQKIAEIPFHFIIKVTPDKRLGTVFSELDIKHQSHFYWRKQPPGGHLKQPTSSYPLIYNMLGSIDQQESMVLTHNDLFYYFESIFSGNSFPEKFKRIIKEANNFLFLGIPFEKWYMQLLLRILYIHTDYDFARYASNQLIDDETKSFCFEQFKIEFVRKHIHEFIDELHQRANQRGLVRVFGEKAPSVIEKLRKWIAEDRLEEVLEEFQIFLTDAGQEGAELLDDLILLNNRFNRLQKRINQSIIDERDANVQSNKVRKDILNLLNEAEILE